MRTTKPSTPLRNIRRARTLSQSDLARLAQVSQQTISKAESGVVVPSRDVQERIAAILGAPRQELFPEAERVAS